MRRILNTIFLLLVCGVLTARSQELRPLTPDIQVDEATPVNFGSHSPAIAINDENIILIAWAKEIKTLRSKIYARLFDINGKALTNEFRLDLSTDESNAISGKIEVDTDTLGNFYIVWEDARKTGDYQIIARVVSPQGKELSKEISIEADPLATNVARNPTIAINRQNIMMVAWATDSQYITARFFRIVQPEMLEPIQELRVDTNQRLASTARDPQITCAPDGSFVITWVDNRTAINADLATPMVFARQFSAEGKPIDTDFMVNSQVPQNIVLCSAPNLTIDLQKNMIFCWNDGRQYAQTKTNSIYSRTFNWERKPLAEDFQINTCILNDRPAIGIDFRDNFTIINSQTTTTAAEPQQRLDHLFAQRYQSGYRLLGKQTQIDQDRTVNMETQYDLVMNAAGNLFTTWIQNELVDQQNFIYAGRVYLNIYAPTGLPPAAATNLTAIDTGSTYIHWRWNYTTNANLVFYLKDEADQIVSRQISGDSLSWIETGLLSNQRVNRRVFASNQAGESLASNTVTLFTRADPPASIGATDITATQVTLVWKALRASRFAIERASDLNGQPDAWRYLTQQADSTQIFVDFSVMPLTAYWYRVRSYNAAGKLSLPSQAIRLVTEDVNLTTPTDFRGWSYDDTSIFWSWQDQATDAIGYIVTDPLGMANVDTLPANSRTFLETGLAPNALQIRQVRAIAINGKISAPSNADTVATLATAPQNVTVIDSTSSSLTLQWRANNASAFWIQRAVDQNGKPGTPQVLKNWTDQYKLAIFTDLNLQPATRYWYWIQSYNQQERLDSNVTPIRAKTLDYSPPTLFQGHAGSPTEITWSWVDNSTDELGFQVMTSQDSAVSPTLAPNTRTWSETGLQANRAYSRLVEVIAAGNQIRLPSNTRTVYTLATAPTNLQLVNITATSISLTWVGSNASRFAIERGIFGLSQNVVWQSIRSWEHELTQNSWEDTGLEPETIYFYRIYAYNAEQRLSEASYEVEATTLPSVLTPPTELKGSALGSDQIAWSWKDNTAFEIGYRVRDEKKQLVSNDLLANTTNWLDDSLQVNVPYSRQVFAVNSTGEESGGSNLATIYTLAVPPTGLRLLQKTSTSVSLVWMGHHATRFGIERAQDSTRQGLVWQTIQNWEHRLTDSTFVDQGLIPDTRYHYRIFGYNGDKIATRPGNELTVITTIAVIKPPTQFQGIAVAPDQINWSWQDQANNESGYQIKDEQLRNVTGILSVNTTSWSEKSLVINAPYIRHVFALSDMGDASVGSNPDTVYTLALPPTYLKIQRLPTAVNLTWSGNNANLFKVERSLYVAGLPADWDTVTSIITESHFYDSPLELKSSYQYRIYAYNGDYIRTEPSQTVVAPAGTTVAIRGDVNQDARISFHDLPRLVDIVLQRGASPNEFERYTANFYYADQEIDIHDIVALIDTLIISSNTFMAPANPPQPGPMLALTLAPPSREQGAHAWLNLAMQPRFRVLAFELMVHPDAVAVMAKLPAEDEHRGFHLHTRQIDNKLRGVLYLANPESAARNPEIEFSVLSSGGAELDLNFLEIVDLENKCWSIPLASEPVQLSGELLPVQCGLLHNYPNPFNSGTEIRFQSTPTPQRITLSIYNLLGQEIVVLIDAEMRQGSQKINWDGRNALRQDVPSGIYICQLLLGGRQFTHKLVMVR
ncbi:T9SS type A sorting domain-containing protein [candidate division KSB1 bacterium]|nr:T9SS type A sorting domain-containing protein [candidate division KSB1 bacterium]